MDCGSDDEDTISAYEDFGGCEDNGSLQVRPNKEVTQKSLMAAQIDDLKDVAETLNIKMHHARTLLIHHRWDKERLCNDFVEKGAEQLFAEAGLPYQTTCSQLEPLNMEEKILCGICFEDVEQQCSTQMDCGHCFCNDCWTGHFISNIGDGQSRRLKCMAVKCGVICDEDKVLSLLSAKDPKSQRRYQRFLLESYIEDNAKVKWCPRVPHCGNAVRIECDPCCEIECICGHQFCYNCLREAHSPCSCTMWQLWTKKCADESETANWITVHTKSCPKCNKPVEKNGGCNLVSCICGQSFCWLCGAATGRTHTWQSIQGHSCGRYKGERAETAARARLDLARYTHYYTRYLSHADSFKREEKQRKSVQENISVLQACQLELTDYSWLTNAVHVLLRARRALQYSYVFAYYMFGNDLVKEDISLQQNKQNQDLFEVQQQIFEEYIERLSKCIEIPLTLFDDETLVSDTRLAMIGLATIVDQRCQKMYDIIENEFLSSLITSSHHISPYNSGGPEKVTVIACLSDSMDETLDDEQSEYDSTIMVEQCNVDKVKDKGTVVTKSSKVAEDMRSDYHHEYDPQKGSLKRPFEEMNDAADT